MTGGPIIRVLDRQAVVFLTILSAVAILVLIILFIQKRPRGLFALRGRAVEA